MSCSNRDYKILFKIKYKSLAISLFGTGLLVLMRYKPARLYLPSEEKGFCHRRTKHINNKASTDF